LTPLDFILIQRVGKYLGLRPGAKHTDAGPKPTMLTGTQQEIQQLSAWPKLETVPVA